jgi:hypothetical protein
VPAGPDHPGGGVEVDHVTAGPGTQNADYARAAAEVQDQRRVVGREDRLHEVGDGAQPMSERGPAGIPVDPAARRLVEVPDGAAPVVGDGVDHGGVVVA